MMRIMARRMKAATVVARRSKSRAKRRLRLIQANVLSTIHRLGKTSNPAGWDRFTISNFHAPVRPHTSAVLSPAYPPSAKREQSARPAQKMECSITVLNVGRMNNDVQQETQRIDQDVPFTTFDLLARVV